MVKAKKLASGAWNIRAYSHEENGKKIYKSITAPTKAECEYAYAEFRKSKRLKPASKMTVREAVENYILMSSEVLAPSTIWNYKKILKYAFKHIMDTPLDKLNNKVMQGAINRECHRKCERKDEIVSAKTVHNEWELLNPALKAKGYRFTVKLPKVHHKNDVLPETSIVFNTIKGSGIELPCLLAMWCSLRLSEVRGLTCADIQGDVLCVNQVTVRVEGKDITKALGKTDASIRKIQIPPYVMQLIRDTDTYKRYCETGTNEPLINMTGYHITNVFYRLAKNHKLDISFHDLRHYFATISLGLGINPKLVQTAGGWSSEKIMMDIYNQSINSEQQKASLLRNAYFDDLIAKCETEI